MCKYAELHPQNSSFFILHFSFISIYITFVGAAGRFVAFRYSGMRKVRATQGTIFLNGKPSARAE